MAMEGSKSSGSAADSYIGSLISLTSKSEIRYEGVLYNINTDESSIGLRDVRSFGTEGRKKDGLQVPPSDRLYEYILFRGSDIKDLQVKSSPASQTFSAVNSDPAIIQSLHPRPALASTSIPNAIVSSTTVTSSEVSQLGQPASNIQNVAPLYQPGVGNVGTWGPSLSSANGMPMYWQGYYAPPSGQFSYQNQQPLMRPPGHSRPPLLQQQTNQYLAQHMPPLHLPSSLQQVSSSLQPQIPASLQNQMSSALQQQMPYLQQQMSSSLQQVPSLLQHQLPSFQQHLPSMNQQMHSLLHQPLLYSSLSTPNEKSTLPAPPSLFTSGSSSGPSGILTSTSSSTSTVPSNLPPTFPLLPVTSLGLDVATSSMPAKAPIAPPALTDKTPVTSLSPAASLLSSDLNGNSLFQQLSSKPITTTSPSSQLTASVPQAVLSNAGSGNPISIQTPAPAPALVTPGQLLKSSSISSVPASQAVHKDVEVVQVSSASAVEPPVSFEPEKKLSVLPLATPLRPLYKPNRVPTHNGYRGRGRGRGRTNSRPLMSFNEEFDFTAMNEKFKKDEVWGHLGKSGKLHDKQVGAKHVDEELSKHKDVDLPKPVYNKDDFFDSLSSNTQDQESNHGRHRFSEQRKLDTETFGEFSRYRAARGGHGPGRRNYRGSFNGRGHGRGGYGYGSGRGRGGPNRVS